VLWESYVIVRRPSVGRPSGNDVGPYRRDQSTSRADKRRGRGHRQSPTDRLLPPTLSVVTEPTELQTAAAPLQWGVAECRVSKHAVPPAVVADVSRGTGTCL